MKYLITVMMLVMGLAVQAQEDQRIIRMPMRVAKQIQQDLITKDSCQAMLQVANSEIELLGKNIEFKEIMIDSFKSQLLQVQKQVENEKAMKITYKGLSEDCKTDYDLLKKTYTGYKKFTKVIGFLGTAVIAGLTAVVIFVK